MPTWDEVRARLRGRLRLRFDTQHLVAVLWRLADQQNDQQEVLFEPGQVQEAPWLVITAKVFAQSCLEPDQALRHSAGMAAGSLVLVGESYFVRHAMPLSSLDFDDLERATQLIAAEAIRLRRSATTTP